MSPDIIVETKNEYENNQRASSILSIFLLSNRWLWSHLEKNDVLDEGEEELE